jgi:hypothetical protein
VDGFAVRRTCKPDCRGAACGAGGVALNVSGVNALPADVVKRMSSCQQSFPAPGRRVLARERIGTARPGSGGTLKTRRDHTAAIIPLNPSLQRVGRGDQKRVRPRRLVVFKLPAYDPVAIAVMGFGIVFAVALALAF